MLGVRRARQVNPEPAQKSPVNPMEYLVRPSTIEPRPLGENHHGGLCRPLVTPDGLPSERTTIALRTYEPGAASREQKHADQEVACYVVEGCMTARVAGTRFDVEEGDLLFVPRATPYRLENSGGQPLSFLHVAVALDPGPGRNARQRGVYHLRTADIQPVVPGGTHKNMTSRQCIRPERVDTERLVLDISTYGPGGGNSPLAHPDAEQAYYVLAGTMRAYVADRQYDAQPGDIVFIPRNAVHWHENATQGEMPYMLIGTRLA